MLSENSKLGQYVYTAGGHDDKHGSFEVWSLSEDVKNDERELQNLVSRVFRGDYDSHWVYKSVLKQGAKPNLFGKYRDKDYENVKVQVRHKIEVLNGVSQGTLTSDDYNADYRNNPEDAPYRICFSKLSDGRSVLVRVGYVNKVYSTRDLRNGNYFAHAIILPKGIEMSDIDLSQIKFIKGLSSEYWGKDAQKAPELLPQTSIKEMQSEKYNLENSKILDAIVKNDLYRWFSIANDKNMDRDMRNQASRNLYDLIKQGSSFHELIYLSKLYEIEQLMSGIPYNKVNSDLSIELEQYSTPYDSLFEVASRAVRMNSIDSDSVLTKAVLDLEYHGFDLKSIINATEFNRKCIVADARINSFKKGEKFDAAGPHIKSESYRSMMLLDRTLKNMLENRKKSTNR